MPQKAESDELGTRYPLRFGTAAFLLVALTLVLVLVVIPQRYVLSPGFVESGLRFPAPTTPFRPIAAVPIPATPLPGGAPVLPTPAEIFWADLAAVLETAPPRAALPLFEPYLDAYPADREVRRELARTLLAAGRPEEAVAVLEELLAESSDPTARLLLARTLRDMGRLADASREYATLARDRPGDPDLALEWARAHAWFQDHETAAAILEAALAVQPSSSSLRAELGRSYYSIERRLHDAIRTLASLSEADLESNSASALWSDVVGALSIAPSVASAPSAPTEPSLLEQALGARGTGDFVAARALLERSLAARPRDRQLWLAYANLLEYELADLEGARAALLEAERIGPSDPAVQVRLAQLDVWTGRNDEATARLETLLATRTGGGLRVERADVHALLGDLHRWGGRRSQAAAQYRLALAERPNNLRASDGLAALEEEVSSDVLATERPRTGGLAYSVADTDEFGRLDLGAQWIAADGRWVWGGVAGSRWLQGYDLDGTDASRGGIFVELDVARWWRWGTLRTGIDFGAQRVLSDWDLHVGASLRHRTGPDVDTELRYEHGLAYDLAGTLQSALAQVAHDRLTLSHARRFGERWSLAAVADAARFTASAGSGAAPGATTRLQLAVSAGRSLGRTLTLGLATRALTFTDEAALTTAPGPRPLFWDPRLAVSVGPFLALDRPIAGAWRLTGRLNPGLALLDERRRPGTALQLVPHASLEAGVQHDGPRLWTALDLFYYQGQFDGYRSYGARVSVGTRRRVSERAR